MRIKTKFFVPPNFIKLKTQIYLFKSYVNNYQSFRRLLESLMANIIVIIIITELQRFINRSHLKLIFLMMIQS